MSQSPSAGELAPRILRLRTALAEQGLDGALITSPVNLYYFSGTAQQAHLWVPADGEPLLLVRRVLERARRESPMGRILPLTSLRELAPHLGGARRIGMELDRIPVTTFGAYRHQLEGVEIQDIGQTVRRIRSVKSPWEVERIRAAAAVADRTYQAVREALREGLTELELSAVAETAERLGGTQGHIRWYGSIESVPVLVLAGESLLATSFMDTPFAGEGLSPAAPYGPGRRVIRRGMPVCIDYPTQVAGYAHDQTRTLAIGGLDAELTRAYGVCQEILAALETEARPGATGEALWERALAIARQAGLEANFMGYGESRARFVGHGLGLEVNEPPVIAPRQGQPLEAGNVIALEPKFFFPGKGAVGLENTYLVTEAGLEKLSQSDEALLIKPG